MTDATLTVIRVAVGLFFLISGFHKLFNAGRHATLVRTLKADGVPLVSINQWWVPTVEYLCGLSLLIGFLTPLCAIALLVLMEIAIVVDGAGRIPAMNPIDWADKIACFLYLPEVLLFLLLLPFLWGAGPYSVDRLLFGG